MDPKTKLNGKASLKRVLVLRTTIFSSLLSNKILIYFYSKDKLCSKLYQIHPVNHLCNVVENHSFGVGILVSLLTIGLWQRHFTSESLIFYLCKMWILYLYTNYET